MADIAGAFFRGHEAGQQQQQHQQAMEDNKLRALVLKHELDRLKIDDQVRTRALAAQNLQFLHGQPAADIPSDEVTSHQPNLPSRSLAGMVSGLQAGAASNVTGAPAAENPGSRPAPDAQATAPETHDVLHRIARMVDIPGVPGLGVPGVSVRPQSLQDIVQAEIASKMAEPYTLNPGGVRMIGGMKIGEGGPAFHSVGAGGLAATEGGETKLVVPGRAGAAQRPLVVNGQVLDPNDPTKVLKVVPPQVRPPNPNASSPDERKARDQQRRDRDNYNAFVKQWDAEQASHRQPVPGADPTDIYAPRERAPYEAPPTIEDWLQSGRPNVQRVHQIRDLKAKGQDPFAAAGTAAAKDGDVKPIPGYPGTEQTFRNGKWIRTK